MKISYIANHGCGFNDDEGAIAHALKALGHEIAYAKEGRKRGRHLAPQPGDVLLFHKWSDINSLESLKGQMPRVFWYFDLVDYPDLTLAHRNSHRIEWMEKALPHVELGFCTDGDWVARAHSVKYPPAIRENSYKLRWLTQGADERVMGFGGVDPEFLTARHRLLFTGSVRGGLQRDQFLADMQELYSEDFHHVLAGTYGRQLADLIANSDIVLAPYGPVSDMYWSNRLYISAGYGAFLLHPYSAGAALAYEDKKEVCFYRSKDDMVELIDYYLNKPDLRTKIKQAAYRRTLTEHTYRHRCKQLIQAIQQL